MRAITLTQPWATLVAIGAKRIETRSWATSYRGRLAIHAAKGLGPVGGKRGLRELCSTEPFCSVLNAWANEYAKSYTDLKSMVERPLMPLGCVVATCELVECVSTSFPPRPTRFIARRPSTYGGREYIWDVTEQEAAFGDYSHGRYAWLLGDVRMLPEPIPAKGALGLWETHT